MTVFRNTQRGEKSFLFDRAWVHHYYGNGDRQSNVYQQVCLPWRAILTQPCDSISAVHQWAGN